MSPKATMLGAMAQVAMFCTTALGVVGSHASDFYTTVTVTSGTAPERRAIGFANCFRDVLVKLSGNQSLLAEPEVDAQAGRAGELISGFTFRDRLSGVPMHDEQGSYDRPHDLTCIFDRAKLDAFLASLGSKPWLDRPRLVAVIGIRDMKGAQTILASDGATPRDRDMRTALAAAADKQGLDLAVPGEATIAAAHLEVAGLSSADPVTIAALARASGGDMALVGTLVWSVRSPPGWIAEWHLAGREPPTAWGISGVGFDDAFRNGVGGAAQVLSGNEAPR